MSSMHLPVPSPPGKRLALDPQWLVDHHDALDAYTEEHIRCAIASTLAEGDTKVVYAYETVEIHGRCASVATAAHVAGLAYYEPEMQRSVHAELGPWIAYRAIIILRGVYAPALAVPNSLPNPLTRSEMKRVGELQRDCFARWDDADEASNWERLRAIVDAFDIGRRHRWASQSNLLHPRFSNAKPLDDPGHCAHCIGALPNIRPTLAARSLPS